MSDDTQAQQDAAMIAAYRAQLFTAKDGALMVEFENGEHEPLEVDDTDAAFLRYIDRLERELVAVLEERNELARINRQLTGDTDEAAS
jgi:hypothetical protein